MAPASAALVMPSAFGWLGELGGRVGRRRGWPRRGALGRELVQELEEHPLGLGVRRPCGRGPWGRRRASAHEDAPLPAQADLAADAAVVGLHGAQAPGVGVGLVVPVVRSASM